MFKENKIWLGHGFDNGNAYFGVRDVEYYENKPYFDKSTGLVKFRNVDWFTNLDFKQRYEDLLLYKQYAPEEYPKYDNYDVINVDKTREIPMDYKGVMGVPISFLDKHNPDQFEVLGLANSARWIGYKCLTLIEGRKIYNRIFIKNKRL